MWWAHLTLPDSCQLHLLSYLYNILVHNLSCVRVQVSGCTALQLVVRKLLWHGVILSQCDSANLQLQHNNLLFWMPFMQACHPCLQKRVVHVHALLMASSFSLHVSAGRLPGHI